MEKQPHCLPVRLRIRQGWMPENERSKEAENGIHAVMGDSEKGRCSGGKTKSDLGDYFRDHPAVQFPPTNRNSYTTKY